MYLEAVRRYPVKSMLGEELTESEVTERGLAGDRARAVLDVATGKIASAKNPRLWRGLLTIEGTGVPGDEELSTLLGREVRLIDVPPEGAEFERSVPERVLAEGIEAEVPHTVGTLGGASPAGTFFG
ncbi:MOSC N-terminal beta barrel domain-containing protein [Nonomuraea angiospora]|uniref:MOSC N-terminal beta barrel domain-containing protein n=1 Tax=Nonomuraea angiospora TaxID=46172 RepID=UPI0033EBA259